MQNQRERKTHVPQTHIRVAQKKHLKHDLFNAQYVATIQCLNYSGQESTQTISS